jgi:hypothetical protein
MDAPHRIKVKYFVQDPAAINLPAFAPIFQRWIQEHRVDGLLLDVADYKHVQDGPGIVLIGHEADYGMDLTGGRPGLVYDYKRGWDANASLQERLRVVLRGVLSGCQVLEADPVLEDGIHFRLDEAELAFVDRLRTPNQPAVFDAVVAEIRPVLDALYGHNQYTLTRASDDPRRALTIHLSAVNTPALSTLLERVQRSPVAAVATNGAGLRTGD